MHAFFNICEKIHQFLSSIKNAHKRKLVPFFLPHGVYRASPLENYRTFACWATSLSLLSHWLILLDREGFSWFPSSLCSVWLVAGDHEADECDTYVQPMPPNSVQILKFRTHFFEVIEELRMRRVCGKDESVWKSYYISYIYLFIHCQKIWKMVSINFLFRVQK